MEELRETTADWLDKDTYIHINKDVSWIKNK